MGRILSFHRLRRLVPLLLLVSAAGLAWRPVGAANPSVRVLAVGGGPEPKQNQVAIERHVAYFMRLLRPGTPRHLLFADGDPTAKTVLFEEEPRALPPGERAFALILGDRDDASPTVPRFRTPQLGRLNGPASREAVTAAFEWLKQGDPDRALLFFAGHGSQPRDRDLDNNLYDLWGEQLSVRDLAAHLATLPARTAVTLVMVQCYSGSFGNLIFKGGNPAAGLADREVVGFFAAPRERMAAGCTPELNEASYQDFSSYFFAALTGRDRVGRSVTGADYNRDGRVGMDEAFAYTLAHDASIDVPTCTSDVFLRWALPIPNEELFQTPYSQVRAWATPAQGAALEALSRDLELTGDDRPAEAFRMMVEGLGRGRGSTVGPARRRFRAARLELREPLLERWPELMNRGGSGYAPARAEAIAELERRAASGSLKELADAEQALSEAEEQQSRAEIRDARVLRFVRLAKSVVLAHRLRESGDPTLRKRFERLVKAEAGPLLPVGAAAKPAAGGLSPIWLLLPSSAACAPAVSDLPKR
jgi:hypothetical protein